MAWCEMRSHSESSARGLQAYEVLCEEIIAWVSENTEFHCNCNCSVTFYVVSLVAHCEDVWWVKIEHRLILKAGGAVNKLQIAQPLQLEKKNNNHGNEDLNYTAQYLCTHSLPHKTYVYAHMHPLIIQLIIESYWFVCCTGCFFLIFRIMTSVKVTWQLPFVCVNKITPNVLNGF